MTAPKMANVTASANRLGVVVPPLKMNQPASTAGPCVTPIPNDLMILEIIAATIPFGSWVAWGLLVFVPI